MLAGCRSHGHAATADADQAALASARAGELALLSSYAEGTPDHTAHLTHLRALGGAAPTPGASASPAATAAYTDVRSSVTVFRPAPPATASFSAARRSW